MGTRADFYIGTGASAEWLGSLAFDGYRIGEMKMGDAEKSPDNMACWQIKSATAESDFRKAVADLLALNDDATEPKHGWPWPWANSKTTDYAYAFVDDLCKVFSWGGNEEWPDMTDKKNVTFFKRGGLLIVGA